MMNEQNDKKIPAIYSKRVKAGKKRTYFFDVRATRANDYFITITESRKRFEDEGYDRHKIFLYKEDFVKFVKGLQEAVDHVKTELMPNFDFEAYNHDTPTHQDTNVESINHDATQPSANENKANSNNNHVADLDKW